MKDSDVDNFTTLLNETGKLFKYDITPMTIEIYWNCLERFDFAELHRALMHFIQGADQGKFMPKPAEIVRLIEGDSQSNSQAAWTSVDKAVRSVGPYQSVVFDDPVTMRVIQDMGGWIQLCNHCDEDYTFRANEFNKRYQSFSIRQLDQYPNKLIGITESSNGRTGHESFKQPPVMVGNRDKCLAIYHRGKTTDQQAAENRLKQQQFEELIEQQTTKTLDYSGSENDEKPI